MDNESTHSTASKTPKCLKKLPFSYAERELIVALVRERPIIENKRTHAKNIQLKKKAWEELAVAFNSQPYVSQRNHIQLKRCWENIKSQRKNELSQEYNNMKVTGGGPPQNSSEPTENIVDAICPFINLRVPDVIDSNTIEISEDVISLTENNQGMIFEKENQSETVQNTINENDKFEAVYIPSAQPKRKPSTTTTSERGLITEIESRKKRCVLNIHHDEELHDLRVQREKIITEREKNLLQYEREIHELQKEKLKLEIEVLRNKI